MDDARDPLLAELLEQHRPPSRLEVRWAILCVHGIWVTSPSQRAVVDTAAMWDALLGIVACRAEEAVESAELARRTPKEQSDGNLPHVSVAMGKKGPRRRAAAAACARHVSDLKAACAALQAACFLAPGAMLRYSLHRPNAAVSAASTPQRYSTIDGGRSAEGNKRDPGKGAPPEDRLPTVPGSQTPPPATAGADQNEGVVRDGNSPPKKGPDDGAVEPDDALLLYRRRIRETFCPDEEGVVAAPPRSSSPGGASSSPPLSGGPVLCRIGLLVYMLCSALRGQMHPSDDPTPPRSAAAETGGGPHEEQPPSAKPEAVATSRRVLRNDKYRQTMADVAAALLEAVAPFAAFVPLTMTDDGGDSWSDAGSGDNSCGGGTDAALGRHLRDAMQAGIDRFVLDASLGRSAASRTENNAGSGGEPRGGADGHPREAGEKKPAAPCGFVTALRLVARARCRRVRNEEDIRQEDVRQEDWMVSIREAGFLAHSSQSQTASPLEGLCDLVRAALIEGQLC